MVKQSSQGDNLVFREWSAVSTNVTLRIESNGMRIVNGGDEDGYLRLITSNGCDEGLVITVFEGICLSGNSGVLYQVDEYNRVLGEATLGSKTIFDLPANEEHALLIKIFPHSSMLVFNLTNQHYETKKTLDSFFSEVLSGSVVFVVPTYPTQENRYLCAFVHARVKSYLAAGIKCDVVCAYDYDSYCSYEYEGVRVLRIPLSKLQTVLSMHRYRVIISHFFDLRYAAVFDACDLGGTKLVIKTHGPETRYWDYPEFATPYFEKKPELTNEQVQEFEARDSVIKRYNQMNNVVWFFPSEKLKKRSEDLIGIVFERFLVIPDMIDEHLFSYKKKNKDLRRKIFFNRKFDNIATYAIDISSRVILELSTRPYFSDLEFNIYGTGGYYNELTNSIAQFENVHLHPYFLKRSELPKVHAENGIGLFATRFDTQGVSMGEAAMSGLAVVSSKIDAAEYFLPNDYGLLADVEDPAAYADIVENLYNDPEYFQDCSRMCHEKMYQLCRSQVTIEKEIDYVSQQLPKNLISKIGKIFNSRGQ